MSGVEFQPFSKIARLNRNVVISEKLDGTNAAVVIASVTYGGFTTPLDQPEVVAHVVLSGDREYAVFAQSRTRFITPGKSTDNYGFAAWVQRNAEALVETLGEGTHFGEWWGAGIQRGYGLKGGDKRFSLFNTKRWASDEGLQAIGDSGIAGLDVVPVLYEGPFNQRNIDGTVFDLSYNGSVAAMGFMRPEGVVVFHTASRESYKVTLENDAAPKGAAGHALDEEKVTA